MSSQKPLMVFENKVQTCLYSVQSFRFKSTPFTLRNHSFSCKDSIGQDPQPISPIDFLLFSFILPILAELGYKPIPKPVLYSVVPFYSLLPLP